MGALACQKDSYLQSLKTVVVSCVEPVAPKATKDSKAKAAKTTSPVVDKLWAIECADSVLFPEGIAISPSEAYLRP